MSVVTGHLVSVGGGNSSPDFDGLPKTVAEKLERLNEKREDSYGSIRNSAEKVEQLKESLGAALREQKIFAEYLHTSGAKAEEKRQAAVDAKVTKAQERLDRARRRHDELSASFKNAGGLFSRCETYIGEVSLIELHDEEVTIDLKDDEELPDAVERIRSELAALAEDAKAVKRAPTTAAEAKRIAKLSVDELANRGTPSLTHLLGRGSKIIWPRLPPVMGRDVGGHIAQDIDAVALLAWLNKDKLLAKLEAEIDAVAAEQSGALDPNEREFRLLEIAQKRLDLERAEEALIEMAEEKGMTIDRRREADVRAVLNLSARMPAPK